MTPNPINPNQIDRKLIDTPTLHDFLEVSAAIGAETGDWEKLELNGLWWNDVEQYGCSSHTLDELDAQAWRLMQRLAELGYELAKRKGGWCVRKPHERARGSVSPNCNTAVYLAAKKVEATT